MNTRGGGRTGAVDSWWADTTDGVRHAFGGSDPARPGDRSGRADRGQSLVREAWGHGLGGGPAGRGAGRPRDLRRARAGDRAAGRGPGRGGRSRGARGRARPRGGRGGRGPRRQVGPVPPMTMLHERSAGVIPYRVEGDRTLAYLVLHSATVRNPRAKWEFPKGGME